VAEAKDKAEAKCKYGMIYLLTAIGLPPGGSCTVHIYTQTIHRTTQNKQYKEQHKNFGRVRSKLANLRDYPVLIKVRALPAITPPHIRA
jgi:hypothetical protein